MTLPVDFILSFRLTVKIYLSTFLHVHKCTCLSVYLFSLFLLFWHNIHNDLSTHLLGYLHTDPPEIKYTCLPSNHNDLPVTTTTCVPAHRCTRSPTHLLIFTFITVKIYSSTFLLFYMSTYVPVHYYTCSVYFFFFGITFAMTFQLV